MACLVLLVQHLQPGENDVARVQAPSPAVFPKLAPHGAKQAIDKIPSTRGKIIKI